MKFVRHPLIKKDSLESRLYQETVLQSAVSDNLLCVLPTGLGKTAIAVVVSAYRMEKEPSSRVMVLAPTKPLAEQHFESFRKLMELPEKDFVLVTGQTKPEERTHAYEGARIIFATPQTIRNDLKNERLSLKDFSLVVFDEAHHAVGDYAYPYIAGRYEKEARNKLILGLTASPGGTRDKIKEIMNNLGIKKVEIRTEDDYDVKPWVKKKTIEWISVNLPASFDTPREHLRKIFDRKVSSLRRVGFTKPSKVVSRRDLLDLNRRLQASSHGPTKFWGVMVVSQAIKIEHSLTLLETQGIPSLSKYFRKIASDKAKSSRSLMKDRALRTVMTAVSKLDSEGHTHPKISKLCELVSNQMGQKPDSKIIIFANYRDMVKGIVKTLSDVENAMPVEFMGQKEGITQQEQKKRISDFREGKYNVLVTTSVGEEGIDIPEMELAIFYEPVPSEIRLIQRRGRVGRTKLGRVIILMAKNTRDEAYYWTANRKEKTMKSTLYSLKNESSGGEKSKRMGQLKIGDF